MSTKQFVRRKAQVEDALRRFGIEGEDAFYVLAYHYVIRFRDSIEQEPARIVSRGESGHVRIEKEHRVLDLVDSLVLSDPKGQRLPDWYQHFVGRRFRKGSGKFFTPHPIASAMAQLLPRAHDSVIMDPTCGGGTFLVEASRVWGSLPCKLIGNDIEPSLIDLAQLVLDLATPKHHIKQFLVSDIYDPHASFRALYGTVDYILANPPFSLKIEGEQFDSELFSLGYRNSDALFLDISLKLLRRGGRLACLLPHSITANKEFERLRQAIEDSWDLLGVIGMPEGVFYLAADTTTRADIVVLEKRGRGRKRPAKRVFAFAPLVGVRLNNVMPSPQTNYLANIVQDPQVRQAFGLNQES